MKQIEWTKLAAIAEILSAIAIVLTLIYLSVQTNELRVQTQQTNEQMAAQARYNYYQRGIDFSLTMALDERLRAVTAKMLNGEELSQLEEGVLTDWYLAVFNWWEYQFGESQRGLLSDEVFNLTVKRRFYSGFKPATENTWERFRDTFTSAFREYFDQNIAAE